MMWLGSYLCESVPLNRFMEISLLILLVIPGWFLGYAEILLSQKVYQMLFRKN